MMHDKRNILAYLLLIFLTTKIVASDLRDWKSLESNIQDCVVQVISQVAKFNWIEPYKSPEQGQAGGTAFFISPEGHMLTNFHVIDQAKSIYINVPSCGRKPMSVNILGVYPEEDVALLQLTKESYKDITDIIGYIPYLNLGDSDALHRTEPVLVLGYPLGQRYLKSTVGVVAGRDYMLGSSYLHVTAPINPGNSGGPLLDTQGNVIGISVAYMPAYQNICYAIPISEVKSVLEDLYKVKLYKKPYVGTGFNPSTDEHTQLLGNPMPGGVYINYILPGSLAEKAGIKKGDMLYEIVWQDKSYIVDEYGDVRVDWRGSDKVQLGELVNRFQLKDEIIFVIYRNGEKLELNLLFDCQANEPIRYIHPDYEPEEINYEIFGGAVFMQLRENHFNLLPDTPGIKKYKQIAKQHKNAIVITNIFPGSMIDRVHCFHPGMILNTVNDKKIKNLQDLREALFSSLDTGSVCIKTKDGAESVLSIDKVLDQEHKLANNFVYPISKTINDMIDIKNK